MAERTAKQEMADEVRKAFGQTAMVNNKGTQKVSVMTFSQKNVYLGLKLVSSFDEKNGVQRDPVPRITASFNGQFVEYPIDGKFWKEYADFVAKFAEVLEGVHIENSTVIDDVDFGKKMMAQFRNRGA
jgi:hypothetical protein